MARAFLLATATMTMLLCKKWISLFIMYVRKIYIKISMQKQNKSTVLHHVPTPQKQT